MMFGVLSRQTNRLAPTLRQQLFQKANVVSGPPAVRVSMREKAAVGLVMVILMLAPSGYIMMNLKHYKNRD